MLQTRLPAELVLESLSYLSLQQLCPLLLVSSRWGAFISANKSVIYRNAAVLHRFMPSPDTTLANAIALYPEQSMVGVSDWKTFCKRRFQIEKAWIGRGTSTIKSYPGTGMAVHRFKVDEDAGFIISTSDTGGLVVTELATNEVLWSLPPRYIHSNAHCEYENGFVCFDRFDGSIEVWHRFQGFSPATIPTEFCPNQEQLDASVEAALRHSSTVGRIQFRPWALLAIPGSHAFRFVFPSLLVASVDQAFLWDVTIPQLSLAIPNTQQHHFSPQPIVYVELSDHFVFICFVHLLRVFSRHDGTPVYDLDITTMSHDTFIHQICLAQERNGGDNMVLVDQPTQKHKLPLATWGAFFLAVHVNGSDLAILFTDSTVAVIRDFERVIKGQIGLNNSSILVSLFPSNAMSNSPATYLAFAKGKIVVTSHRAIYVIVLDGLKNMNISPFQVDNTIRMHPSFPDMTVAAALRFGPKSVLHSPSCLQVSDAAIWFTWDHYIDCRGSIDIEFAEGIFRRTAHRVATVVSIDLTPDDD